MPNTIFTYPMALDAPLPPGHYCALATVAGEPTQRVSFTVTGAQRRSETQGVPPARVRVTTAAQGVPIIVVIAVLTAAAMAASAGFVAGKRRRGRA